MATPTGQMIVTPTRELDNFVREQVRGGAYATPGEYIRDLVRRRYLEEQNRAAGLRTLDAALSAGIADADAGRVVPVKDAFARIRATLGIENEAEPA